MTYQDYMNAVQLVKTRTSREALVMALLKQSSTEEVRKLNALFPDLVNELIQRQNTMDGLLPGESK